MPTFRGSCTNRSLWIAAVCSFVLILGVGVVLAQSLPNVTICHKADDSTEVTITVDVASLAAHAAHGDTPGACGGVCACTFEINPVTCSDGQTYVNPCTALCAGATDCGPVCACTREFKPVTCSNGVTYSNQCLADCAGATGCGPCPCTREFKPVTCSNGVTYSNQCLADCAEATGCDPV